jgi:hypothetical protein
MPLMRFRLARPSAIHVGRCRVAGERWPLQAKGGMGARPDKPKWMGVGIEPSRRAAGQMLNIVPGSD